MNPNPITIVDRDTYFWKFLRAIEPLPTPELRKFLAESVRDHRGTEGEALMIALIEGQLAVRDLSSGD